MRLVLFDVNETLSDMTPLRRRLEDVGAPATLFGAWFAGVLRDGFALTAAGGYAPFADVADAVLRDLLSRQSGWDGDQDEAVRHVLSGFAELRVHPDVADGVRQLRTDGYRLATLTNGAAGLTDQLLTRAGVRSEFETLLDVGAPQAWKPAAAAYRYATDALGVAAEDVILAAVHPWDVDGALRAGLSAAWLRRGVAGYPAIMREPTLVAGDVMDLAKQLGAAG
jgi:2-haloacid dehalogenase